MYERFLEEFSAFVDTFRYEMVYKQAVSAEDVFLGMGLKTPTTASCEDLVVCRWQ